MISREFLTAGHAIFTVSNPEGKHYTYRVTAPDDQNELKPVWFVGCLTGPNNTEDYSYLGLLVEDKNQLKVIWTKKSKFDKEGQAVKVVQWAVGLIWNERPLPPGYKIDHIGQCGRCGRPLTTPESIASGIGPVCAGRS